MPQQKQPIYLGDNGEPITSQYLDDQGNPVKTAQLGAGFDRPPAIMDTPPQQSLAQKAQEAMARTKQPPSMLDTAYQYSGLQGLVEGAKGAVKGLTGTVTNVSNMLGSQYGKEIIPQDFFGINTAPSNTAQSIGKGIEQAAEFAIPDTLAAKASKALPLAARMAVRGATAAGVGTLQGQSPQEAAISGVIGGTVAPVAEAAWPAAKDFVARKITPRMLNSLMGVQPKWLEYGRDPGGRVVKEGMVAGSKDGLLTQIKDKGLEAGRALEAKLTQGGAGKSIDAEPLVISALDNASKRIGMGSDQAFQAKLANVMTDILDRAGGDIKKLTPLEANRLKTAIGESVKWHGEPFEGDVNQALLEIYRGINNATEQAVPGAKSLMARYGDLKVAENALDDKIRSEMTKPLMSGTGVFSNVAKPFGATPFKTRTAQMMNRFDPNKNALSRTLARMGAGGAESQLSPED